MKSALILVLSAFFILSCATHNTAELNHRKIQPILKRVMSIAQDDDLILFTALCNRDIDSNIEKAVLSLGIEIERYIDNYIVMRGTKDQIYKMSELDFVNLLEGTSQNTFRKTYRKGTFELEIE